MTNLKRFSTLVVCICLLTAQAPAQEEKEPKIPGQYKRIHQNAFKRILTGKGDQAIKMLNAFLKKNPDDAETHYMLTVAFSQMGKQEEAVEHMKKALELGLSPGRFLGGTKTGLEGLRDHPAMNELKKKHENELVHGPMLGSVTGTSAKIWVRTADAVDVRVKYSTDENIEEGLVTAATRTSEESDFTAVITIQDLNSATRYYYQLEVASKQTPTYQFQTFPEQGKPVKFRLAFGGGAGFVPEHERMWKTIQAKEPNALFLLGDNVYIDDPTTPAMQHYTYYRRQSRPEFRALISHTPVYSIWDDHDFGTNDCSGGPEITRPAWKPLVYDVFRNNWVNPGYGGGKEQPGCYYDSYIGDVHFIMLDGRYYRNLKKEGQGRSTMLGPVQRQWLFDTLKGSKGKLVVMCSPVPWVFKAKGDSKDTWNGFREERNEIFDFLAEQNIDGVVLMSADRHRSDLWKIEREKGYPLYEFNSSRLTNQHNHAEMKDAVFSYNKKQSFGLVEFDTRLDDPTITYQVVTIDGETVHSYTVKRSQLSGK